MKPAHGVHGPGIQAPGDPAGPGRVRQPLESGRAAVSDPIRACRTSSRRSRATTAPPWSRRTSGRCALRPSASGLLTLARAVLPLVAEAGRDVARLAQGHAGPLRVAVQCHNCFDWLMPAMDAYRSLWPEVELDIISGFVVDPLPLARSRRGGARHHPRPAGSRTPTWSSAPCFATKASRLMSPRHRLAAKPWLEAADFADETLITYPVPDEMLDVMKHCLIARGHQSQTAHGGIDGRHPAAGRERPRHRGAALLDRRQLHRARLRGLAAHRARRACAANCTPRPPAPAPRPPISRSSSP